MDNQTIIAAAQIYAKDENIDYNLEEHYRLIRLAASNGVQLVVFPEMSITGYVREAADRLAFSRHDARLGELKNLASAHHMTIVAGMPIRLGSALHVGSIIIYPDQTVCLYTKQFLYKGENEFFMPNCGNNPSITLGQEKVALAICFDMENTPHIMNAAEAGSTIYSASIFYSKSSIDEAHNLLSTYAKTYSMNVLMSNYTGNLYHTPAGGQSAFWSSNGERLACLEEGKIGLVIATKARDTWSARNIYDNT